MSDKLTDEQVTTTITFAQDMLRAHNDPKVAYIAGLACNDLQHIHDELLAARERLAALEAEKDARPTPCQNECMLIRMNKRGDND